jgi:chain length determinant protein tyrosine kinase EpsG
MGQMLLETGKLSESDIDVVLRMQRNSGLRFGEAAVHLKLITEHDVRQVLSRQFSYHYLSAKHGKFPSELIAAYQPFGKQAETLRAIRSQLLLHWFCTDHKALAIVGLRPGDGTSFLAANLAVIFSQLGEETLLVDANMRAPKQHRIFGTNARTGLSDMLARRSGVEGIAKVDDFVGLSVLTAGTQVPNPQELLSSNVFAALHDNLISRHEIVLYDVPALTTYADALAIAARTKGVLLIVRKDQTLLHELQTQSERLRRCGAEIVGTVMGDA